MWHAVGPSNKILMHEGGPPEMRDLKDHLPRVFFPIIQKSWLPLPTIGYHIPRSDYQLPAPMIYLQHGTFMISVKHQVQTNRLLEAFILVHAQHPEPSALTAPHRLPLLVP